MREPRRQERRPDREWNGGRVKRRRVPRHLPQDGDEDEGKPGSEERKRVHIARKGAESMGRERECAGVK